MKLNQYAVNVGLYYMWVCSMMESRQISGSLILEHMILTLLIIACSHALPEDDMSHDLSGVWAITQIQLQFIT